MDTSSTTSPKRFFRTFNSSPFKTKNREAGKLTADDDQQKAHSRTQSYDQVLFSSPVPHDSNGWLKMIRPMPQGSHLPLSGSLQEKPSNRHTIAIATTSEQTQHMQQTQQPLDYDNQYQNNDNANISLNQSLNMEINDNNTTKVCDRARYQIPNDLPYPSFQNRATDKMQYESNLQTFPGVPNQHGQSKNFHKLQINPEAIHPSIPQGIVPQVPYYPVKTQKRDEIPGSPKIYNGNYRNHSHLGSFHQQPPLPLYSESSPTNLYSNGPLLRSESRNNILTQSLSTDTRAPSTSNQTLQQNYLTSGQQPLMQGYPQGQQGFNQANSQHLVSGTSQTLSQSNRHNIAPLSFQANPQGFSQDGSNVFTQNPFQTHYKGHSRGPSQQQIQPLGTEKAQGPLQILPLGPQQPQGQQQIPTLNDSSSRSTQNPLKTSHKPLDGKKRKTCFACKEIISGQFVRALNNAYHLECFCCNYCGTQCSGKFFSLDIKDAYGNSKQVPLCEYDYFKKLDLICFNCNTALRGPYITALGNKYHLEHFKCSACGKVFESDESYYEQGNDIYCHFHYSKLFATKCEGCHLSIVKQFVELYKGGKNQQWHPECYMVYKFWDVSFTPEAVGLPKDFLFDSAPLSPIDGTTSAQGLLKYEQKIESSVLNCWMILSGYEETTAQCVSEMLLSASTGNLSSGLIVTGKLILYIEVLFNALEYVQNMCQDNASDKVLEKFTALQTSLDDVYSADAFQKFQRLRKEPRNISGKIMSYLAILRKSHQIASSGSLSSELLSVITGCAHYLKLLIRIGLNNALKLNILRGETRPFDTFLELIGKYDEIESQDKLAGDARVSIRSRLSIAYNATDACHHCKKSIEKSCVRFGDARWHLKCFECSHCHRKPDSIFKVELYLYGPDDLILCSECAKNVIKGNIPKIETNEQDAVVEADSSVSKSDKANKAPKDILSLGYTSGFVPVSDLAQLSYLLRIAILRSKAAFKREFGEYNKNTSLPQRTKISEESAGTEKNYTKTLDEITALRTKRESQSLQESVKRRARKSVVLESPSGTVAKSDNVDNLTPGSDAGDVNSQDYTKRRIESSGSLALFIPLQGDLDQNVFQLGKLKIREESSTQLVSNSLDRTTDLLKNEKSLTLDDIPRIVAAEQAREQRPNAFKHHNSLYQKRLLLLQISAGIHNRVPSGNLSQGPNEPPNDEINQKTKYYSELTKTEHFILRHIAMEAILKTSGHFNRDELAPLLQTKKLSNFWDKFKFGAGEKHAKNCVFGVNLSEVCKRYGVDSEFGVGPAQLRIPIIVDDVIRALRQKDMSVEGIFRLNGNIKNLRELTEQINALPLKSPAFDKYSAVQLAALLKKWLRELPNPLLTFNLYELWILSGKLEDATKCKRFLQLTYCMLPRSHRNLLEVLLYFFSWVASFAEIDEETGSKMDTHNLATVIAPNILFSRASATDNGTNQSSDTHFLAIEVVNQLIEMHEELSVIPGDLWQFYKNLDLGSPQKVEQMSLKEILSKIQKVLSENPSQFDISLKPDAAPSHNNTIKRGQATIHVNETVAP